MKTRILTTSNIFNIFCNQNFRISECAKNLQRTLKPIKAEINPEKTLRESKIRIISYKELCDSKERMIKWRTAKILRLIIG
jgi:hypothetical protein